MNDLQSHYEEDEEDVDTRSAAAASREEKGKGSAPNKPDLSWLAPPPRQTKDGILDREWGLGQVKDPSVLQSEEEKNSFEELSAKLSNFHSLKEQGTHFNQSLSNNRSFRNPHIYAKLVEWLEVDETASAYDEMVQSDGMEVDKIWTSTKSARKELLSKASSKRIAEMQKRRQEEIDEEKQRLRGKRERIEFTSSSSSHHKQEQSKNRRNENDDHHRTSRGSDRHRHHRERESEDHGRGKQRKLDHN